MIGCLVEKQLTTPQQYPLTLNALVSACNQSSNRDPVVSFDDQLVQRALRRLKDDGLIRFAYPSHGRSVIRYAHNLGELLALDERRLAVLAVLLLRGPQTSGELRARTDRMAAFDGIGAVEAELHAMSGGAEPLVAQLPRRPGQKEERWAQLLAPEAPGVAFDREADGTGNSAALNAPARGSPPSSIGAAAGAEWADTTTGSPAGAEWADTTTGAAAGVAGQLTVLVDEVASLRAEVAEIRAALQRLQTLRDGHSS